MNVLIIMQGISGSGKSFQTEIIKHYYLSKGIDVAVCSTDNYWYGIGEPGKYCFNINKLAEAHVHNKKMTEHNMKNKVPVIIIDNTNTTQKEAQPYINLGKQYNYEIRVISVSCSLKTALSYNANRLPERQVPESVIIAQSNRIKPINLDIASFEEL